MSSSINSRTAARVAGTISATPGYHENKGEQILFHLAYPQGGLFDIVDAGATFLAVDPRDPRYVGKGAHPLVEFDGTEFSTVPSDIEVNPALNPL